MKRNQTGRCASTLFSPIFTALSGRLFSKKRLSGLLLVLLCLFSLTGCHGSREQAAFQVPESFDTTEPLEITFWAKNDTNVRQTEIYKQAIADFEALYPNITVTLRLYTDYGKIYNDVITNISTGTTPNVCITYPDHIATYLTGENVVVPLDALLDNPEYGLGGSALLFDSPTKEEIIPQFLEECTIGGHTYALPFMRSTEACYVNKTYVEALGYTLPETLTWDFIWEVSEAATKKNADGTFALNNDEVMMLPQYDTQNPQMISQGPSVCIFNKENPQEVLASWLFVQYLLSNDVQIPYSQTEGYVPVTTKAQNSAEYQDYLSRAGEDNDTYYDVKIEAAKLLLEHAQDTFTTPVFNGSTSLRDAAGSLIEEVAKSTRRKETVDDAYMDALYADMTSLYHLDETAAAQGGGKTDLGPLPATAVALLGFLAAAWILILLYLIFQKVNNRSNS